MCNTYTRNKLGYKTQASGNWKIVFLLFKVKIISKHVVHLKMNLNLHLKSVILELSLAHCADKFVFSAGALDLHPTEVGVDGLLVTMAFTCSSTWEMSTLEPLRFSLEAAVESLNCLRAASS